jgi:hypothetical protein
MLFQGFEVLAARKRCLKAIVGCIALVFVADLRASSYGAEERSKAYLNDMRIMACVTAQNAVRSHLRDQGRVSFESCASNKFEIHLAADDRDYKVFGYATISSPNVALATKRFYVRINHDPGSYGDWGFEVTKVQIDP